jgi:hypothetical protein
MKKTTTLQTSHAFVLAEAKANVDFIKSSPRNVEQAKQINAALANIVAMERNAVMMKAIERAYGKDLPQLP